MACPGGTRRVGAGQTIMGHVILREMGAPAPTRVECQRKTLGSTISESLDPQFLVPRLLLWDGKCGAVLLPGKGARGQGRSKA